MIADAPVRLLVATPATERASTVAEALEAASDRVEVRTATPETAVEALASFDADCVVGEVATAERLLATLAADHSDLPVVLFSEAVRSSAGRSTPTGGVQVADVVRVPSSAFAAGDADGDGGSAGVAGGGYSADWAEGLLAGVEGRPGFYVADGGGGVPPADRDRIFEHGYTTAESGTGFGLGIVETVARDHGWTVSLAGGDGGARFEVETGDGEDGGESDQAEADVGR